MPQHRHRSGKSQNGNKKDENTEHDQAGRKNSFSGSGTGSTSENQSKFVNCCIPSGCDVDSPIHKAEPGDAVRVNCNNDACEISVFMHKECFEKWEESVLAYLRSCGRARSWSEKQRLQNLWTKKGYDLAYKACDCKCGKGHIRKDLDFIAIATKQPEEKPKKPKKRADNKAMPTLNVKVSAPHSNIVPNPHLSSPPTQIITNSRVPQRTERIRHSSLTSTGSSPTNSVGSPVTFTPPGTPSTPLFQTIDRKIQFDFCSESIINGAVHPGNIFQRRKDFSAFSFLPRHKQNSYHIKTEDDGPHGNDDVRNFILSNLSASRTTGISCIICRNQMVVYDRYPLIDGTFFLAPTPYDSDKAYAVKHEGRNQFLHGVCMHCLEGNVLLYCASCGRRWDGSNFILGTMYSYDIFAAMPCCQNRLSCKKCGNPILEAICGMQYYSEYSHCIPCSFCKTKDYHFIKPLCNIFKMMQPNRM